VGRRVVVQPFLAVGVVLNVGLGGQWERGGRKKGKNEPRRKSWLILATHCLGLPFPGSPFWLLLPLGVFLHIAGPHPSGDGRGTRDSSSVVGSELGRGGGGGGGGRKGG